LAYRGLPIGTILKKPKSSAPSYFFVIPSIAFLVAILVFPTIYMIMVSFTDLSLASNVPMKFIGVENYKNIFYDERFSSSLDVTVLFLFVCLTVEFGLGLMIALAVDSIGERLKNKLVAIFILPMMMIPIVAGQMWKVMYFEKAGFFNILLVYFGYGRIPWLSNETWSKIAIMVTDIWQWTPFMFLLIYAGLQTIPQAPVEAAVIDGASYLQTLRYVTMPLLRMVIIVAILFRAMDLFKLFDIINIITGGGPFLATETMSLYMWILGFRTMEIGYVSALALLILLISGYIVNLILRRIYRER